MKLNQIQEFALLGRGWLSACGYGLRREKPRFAAVDGPFQFPELETMIPELPARFGRFDLYTKVVFSTAVLALQDAGRLQREGRKPMGIVIGSNSGVYDNDLAYYESTLEEQGAFSSPNLFSYTLPNVALGEIAVYFNIVGPTFCVGNPPADPGREALATALLLLQSGQCDSVLAGWVEVAQKLPQAAPFPKGAAFALLATAESAAKATIKPLEPRKFHFAELFEDNE